MTWISAARRWYDLFGHKLNRSKQAIENISLHNKLKSATPVILYQMGKVGSSSIYWPLKKVYRGAVIHAHNIRADHYAAEVRILRSFLDQNNDAPALVISLVREPISRNISGFFQDFERLVGVRPENYNDSIDKLQDIFLTKYKHEIPHLWFNRRLKRDFNIDVYASTFPEEGHQKLQAGPYRALILRHDLKDDLKEKLVRNFTACPDFKMIMQKNRGSDKSYASLYNRFKKLPLPGHYVEQQLNTEYSQHFYSKKNRMSIAALWTSDLVELK